MWHVVNKRDKIQHETEICEYRKVKCHDCAQIRADIGTLKGSLKGKVKTMEEKMETSINHDKMKKVVGKLEGRLVGMNKMVNEKVEALKDCHDKMKREVRNEVNEVN